MLGGVMTGGLILGGLMLGGPILVGSRGPALIMAACAASAISKAGMTASQGNRRATPLSRMGRLNKLCESRPESLRIALSPRIAGLLADPARSCSAHPPSLFELRRTGAEHPVLRVDAAGAQRYPETAAMTGFPAFAGNDDSRNACRLPCCVT
jgi:hypothetical protein